jgi:cystathionine beta-synthase
VTAVGGTGGRDGARPAPHTRPYESVLELIGWTPLIRLSRLGRGIATPVYAKAEFLSPGGSVKDRVGPAIIAQAEREGRLRPGGTVVEATSGNTGVALAIAALFKGYKCIFTMPDKMSQEKVRLLKAFGAEVVVTPTAVPPDHPENYLVVARRIADQTPNSILADQFYNQANPEAHYATTGPELWEQTEGRITHFVAAAGTGGTVTGVARYLKERNPAVRIVAGDPVGSILADKWRTKGAADVEGTPYKVEGVGQDKIPGALDLSLIDEFQTVSDRESFAMARRLTREEGLFVGGSSGLSVHVALDVARQLNDPDAMVVTVLWDRGERYLTKVYNDEWMRENQLLDVPRLTMWDVLQQKDGALPAIVSTTPGATVRQAIGLMSLHDVSQLPVMDGGKCVGSISDYAVSQKTLENPQMLESTVGAVMDQPFPVVGSGESADAVVKLLSKSSPAVLVQGARDLEGIVTRSDMLRFLMSR